MFRAGAGLLLSLCLPHAASTQGIARSDVEAFWQSKGAPAHVAAGIADNVARESSFDPAALGDGGTSAGLYQMHDIRFTHLLADMENTSAWKDVMGRDPVAAAHWNEILAAPNQKTAARLWARWFERCAACGAQNPRTGKSGNLSVAAGAIAAAPPVADRHQWHDGAEHSTTIRPHQWYEASSE